MESLVRNPLSLSLSLSLSENTYINYYGCPNSTAETTKLIIESFGCINTNKLGCKISLVCMYMYQNIRILPVPCIKYNRFTVGMFQQIAGQTRLT